MTTRQVRLSTPEQIRKKLIDFTGKKINIVMCDRTVFFGELKHLEQDKLTFVNMRQQPLTVPLSDVSEIYLDFNE